MYKQSAGVYTCISLYSHKYVTETDIVGDKEGGMRVKRRAVNTLDGGPPDMDMIPYHSICFHTVEIKIRMRLLEKERRRNMIQRDLYMVNTLNPLPDMDMMALVGSI